MSELREEVREHYAAAARSVKDGMAANDWDQDRSCCAPEEGLGVQLYDITEREQVPDEAVLAALGCGNPAAVADLRDGETVLDLGSGGGIDVLLSARRVGPSGKVYGLDMTQVDVIISNCVINLSTDKPKVIGEMHRVLRTGGRLGISDVVSANELSPAERAERGNFVGCIAGALSFDEYTSGLTRAGFVDIEIEPTHELTDEMFGAIVRARKA